MDTDSLLFDNSGVVPQYMVVEAGHGKLSSASNVVSHHQKEAAVVDHGFAHNVERLAASLERSTARSVNEIMKDLYEMQKCKRAIGYDLDLTQQDCKELYWELNLAIKHLCNKLEKVANEES